MALQGHARRLAARTGLAVAGILALAATACGSNGSAAGGGNGGPVTLRLGYFPNLTHATAIVGVDHGFFQQALGRNVTLRTQVFNAGPAATEALLGGALDATFIGPSPAVNAFVKTHGSVLRIVAGATSGGAALVVRPASHITRASDLRGKTLATPQLGNTQDVALRHYLLDNGLRTDAQGGGDVRIVPEDNSTTIQLFKQGQLDGAWLPEPYATRLVVEAGATVFVDEASLWPNGQFQTTNLVVTTDFLNSHPDVVRNLLTGLVTATDWVKANPTEAKAVVNDALLRLTLKKLPGAELDRAWAHLNFTVDPLASTLRKQAQNAKDVGLVGSVSLSGIFDLTQLNQVLRGLGRPTVSAGGLGRQ